MAKRFLVPLVLIAASSLVLTGCVNNEDGGGEPTTKASVSADESLADMVPADIAKAGVLTIGVDASYAPNEFEGDDGSVTGWDAELAEAVAGKLDLKVEWQKLLFDAILPKVAGGTLDLGWSSFTDNKERQAQVDFVDYYNAGLQFAKSPDAPDLTDFCGVTIALQASTTSEQFLQAESDKCVADGKKRVDMLKSDGQDEATNNAVLGRADYMLGDSPITQYAVAQSDGKLELGGDIFDAAPYGVIVQKDSDLIKAIQAAMQELMDDGTYAKILKKWGVDAGAVTEATINAG
ncbi:amino acid ABC transporter substrate-binding protein, PAAT family [Paramicrobacterium humi]|uniref:Amino acid ABC transporter substrate-binding protein, PAAT family n=1 Tax=Paramicrobacterium humi TaxID=640635 RepID=A0A1H4P159_9MICO|nr:ABC transporter substrate-binding protein [Microbacterium humi]SEC00888.1 amino acid ABC transporter substrate-binding protein, PAAT family [Microbacterium humi]